ncbi:MAG TPA: ribonuclease P protein component [Mycobacteriales bacterium]|nr:ribonuclease P protein component [Mycobacteriales bacterium]
MPAGRSCRPAAARAAPHCPPDPRQDASVLARSSRLHRRADFGTTTARGRRVSAPGLVLHARALDDDESRLVGFVVGRGVGPAVVRNRVRRRLQHLIADRFDRLPAGTRLVVRATPAAAGRSSAVLGAALDEALTKAYPA